MKVGFLMEGVAEGQFQGQIGEKGLLRGRSGGKRAVGLSREGQIRIRRERVFRSQVLFGGVKTR